MENQSQESLEVLPPQAYDIESNESAETLSRKDDRRAELTLKWEKKLESRRLEAEKRKQKRTENYNPNQDAAAFMKRFCDERPSIISTVDDLVSKRENGQITGDELQQLLNDQKQKVQGLQQQVAEAALFLPPYDLRQASSSIAEMTAYIEKARSIGAPRKKFAFRSQRQAKARNTKTSDSAVAIPKVQQSDTEVVKGKTSSTAALEALEAVKIGVESSEVIIDGEKMLSLVGEAVPGSQRSLVVGTSGSSMNLERGQFIRFTDIAGCTIVLFNIVGSLRLINLKDCTVIAVAVDGSCFVENCHRCTFHIASRQVRIHDTSATNFLLSVLSRPIIEDCNTLKFGPWLLSGPGVEEAQSQAGLEKGRTNSTWENVDDFKWLRQQQSPNWCKLSNDQLVAFDTELLKNLVAEPESNNQV